MIGNKNQCIEFITGGDFPLADGFTALEKPWTESPYFWSYRNQWPGMNYRIEIEPAEEFVQVRFFVEQDLLDIIWKQFAAQLADSPVLTEIAPGVIVDKAAATLPYPVAEADLIAQYQKLCPIAVELRKLRGL